MSATLHFWSNTDFIEQQRTLLNFVTITHVWALPLWSLIPRWLWLFSDFDAKIITFILSNIELSKDLYFDLFIKLFFKKNPFNREILCVLQRKNHFKLFYVVFEAPKIVSSRDVQLKYIYLSNYEDIYKTQYTETTAFTTTNVLIFRICKNQTKWTVKLGTMLMKWTVCTRINTRWELGKLVILMKMCELQWAYWIE